MSKRLLVVLSTLFLGAAILVAVAGCGGGGSTGPSNQVIKPTFVDAKVTGDTVAVSLSDVQKAKMAHFRVPTAQGNLVFMAYDFGGKVVTRASVCPPCQSQSFSLKGNTLVCNSCGTIFSASSGDGMSGPCVAYPKAVVATAVADGNLTMTTGDMVTAYQNTLKPGKP